jgi:PPOX class probable F420-dependent enzyme
MSSFDPATAKYVSLVTFRKTGVEVRTPVWIAPLDDKHYVFSEANAGKMKRLRNNPAVKMALCDVRGKILFDEWLDGEAKVLSDPEQLKAVYASFNRKYGLVMRLTDFFSKLSGRYNNRAMIEISLT